RNKTWNLETWEFSKDSTLVGSHYGRQFGFRCEGQRQAWYQGRSGSGLAITHSRLNGFVNDSGTHCLDVSMKPQRCFVKTAAEVTATLLTSWTNSMRPRSD